MKESRIQKRVPGHRYEPPLGDKNNSVATAAIDSFRRRRHDATLLRSLLGKEGGAVGQLKPLEVCGVVLEPGVSLEELAPKRAGPSPWTWQPYAHVRAGTANLHTKSCNNAAQLLDLQDVVESLLQASARLPFMSGAPVEPLPPPTRAWTAHARIGGRRVAV